LNFKVKHAEKAPAAVVAEKPLKEDKPEPEDDAAKKKRGRKPAAAKNTEETVEVSNQAAQTIDTQPIETPKITGRYKSPTLKILAII
jgi:hypothetical protein